MAKPRKRQPAAKSNYGDFAPLSCGLDLDFVRLRVLEITRPVVPNAPNLEDIGNWLNLTEIVVAYVMTQEKGWLQRMRRVFFPKENKKKRKPR